VLLDSARSDKRSPLEVTNRVSSSGVENEMNISKKSVCPKSVRAESRTDESIPQSPPST